MQMLQSWQESEESMHHNNNTVYTAVVMEVQQPCACDTTANNVLVSMRLTWKRKHDRQYTVSTARVWQQGKHL